MAELELKAARPGTVRWRKTAQGWEPVIGESNEKLGLFTESEEPRQENVLERVARIGRQLLLGESAAPRTWEMEPTGVLGNELVFQEGGPTLVNPKSRKLLLDAIKRGYNEFQYIEEPMRIGNAAKAYIKAKYPKLTSRVKFVLEDDPLMPQGYASPGAIATVQPKKVVKGAIPVDRDKFTEIVNDLGHEMRHSLSELNLVRTPDISKEYEYLINSKWAGRPYITTDMSPAQQFYTRHYTKPELKAFKQKLYEGYYRQPEEVLARKAGTTSRNTARKLVGGETLLDLIKSSLFGGSLWK